MNVHLFLLLHHGRSAFCALGNDGAAAHFRFRAAAQHCVKDLLHPVGGDEIQRAADGLVDLREILLVVRGDNNGMDGSETVAGVEFRYRSSSRKLKVYKDGEKLSLQEALDAGWLSETSIHELWGYYQFVND